MRPKRILDGTSRFRLAGTVAAAVAPVILLAVGVAGSLQVRLEQVRVAAPDFPGDRATLKILQISDLHSRSGLSMNRKVAGLLRGLQGDIMVITGDFKLAGGSDEAAVDGGALVASAVTHRLPVYAVRGNNDPAGIMPKLAAHGIRVLDNESTELSPGVWLAGWNPYPRAHPDLGRLMSRIPDGDYVILLSHSPDVILEKESRRAQLILSGHTHGGQIRLPGLRPLVTLTRLGTEYFQGLYPRDGGLLYINRGIGTSMVPLRIYAPPEITVLTIARSVPFRQNPLN